MKKAGLALMTLVCCGLPPSEALARDGNMGASTYRVTINVDYTKTVTDTSTQLNARSTTRIQYSTPLSKASQPNGSYVSLSGRPSGTGTYSVDIAGTDSTGCAFDYKKTARLPIAVRLIAEARPIQRRMITKTVNAPYWLDLVAYPQGVLPSFPTGCDSLRAQIAPSVVSLSDLFGAVGWFNTAETMLVGAWPRVWNYGVWPFGAIGYAQIWKSPPPKVGGVYRLPAPVNALATGKPVTLSKSLSESRTLPGTPTVTIKTVGRISFSFR